MKALAKIVLYVLLAIITIGVLLGLSATLIYLFNAVMVQLDADTYGLVLFTLTQ